MTIVERIPLLEDTVDKWKNELGNDYLGYKNHVYRMIYFWCALHNSNNEERGKIIIAGWLCGA